MRYMFGLVGLLVTVAVIVFAFSQYTAPVAKTGAQAREEATQMSGRDEATGTAATDALTLEPAQRGGRTVGMTVKAVAPGAIQTFYGLQANDVVTQAGDMPLAEPFGGDAQLASSMILEAYKASRPLVVRRGQQQLTLPQAPGTAAAATTSPAAPGQSPTPEPAAAPAQPGGLQKQLDIIRNSGGQ